MTTPLATVLVIAKEPRPGHAKTRLTPPLTPYQAAEVAGAALWDTLRAAARVPARELLLVFDGDASSWSPEGWRTVAQTAGGLDARLVGAFAAARPGPGVLVGMDTPQVRSEQLAVFDPSRYDACLGLATDGGYWAIGFTEPRIATASITGIPMSTAHTGAAQLERLAALGLRVQLLDELTDVDTIESARDVARLAPDSAFAAALAAAVHC
ncbi:MAG: TIGR04282 family arsenosugar biosynthesis glycosyltransferase [Jatrophihabitans sp.]